jgi:hypothetical protein
MELQSKDGKISRHGKMRVDTWDWTSRRDRLYAHYFRAGRHNTTTTIGALTAPCGDLITVVRQFPFKATPGRYRLYFSVTLKLDRADDAWISFARLKSPRRHVRVSAGTAHTHLLPVAARHRSEPGRTSMTR